ncbi:hypothetical protein F3Y22_tig00111200pilonHSYRG00074 [Hibiscus syriacus]|uniref:Filament-like plant protein n=1 Tax=Hibiscus syriacus TaxID=106335 RepID=A0A6A2YVN3_HIBSY|nr:hypothetical protein F3Y22_tig00111200pilonHSYRG00074 [Hibiscus syriacus]
MTILKYPLSESWNLSFSLDASPKASVDSIDVKDDIKSLTEKLSAALVNVSAKEDLVKQHSQVAEEAIAGWEKAENEVVVLKQKLEDAVQQNSALEDPAMEKENSALKLELSSYLEEMEFRTIERDLSIQAAETASKQQVESVKKVNRHVPSSSVEIDLLDGFLDMERLAALPETKSEYKCLESKATVKQSIDSDNLLKEELEGYILLWIIRGKGRCHGVIKLLLSSSINGKIVN